MKKKDKFIVYQGSHGDKGAEIADIILPGAAYTEKNALFINLEGKLQKAYKASYPPGNAKDDWLILQDIASRMKKPMQYKNLTELRNLINKDIETKIVSKSLKVNNIDFIEDDISIEYIDYYYTNAIARSSQVMNECRNIPKKSFSENFKKDNQ